MSEHQLLGEKKAINEIKCPYPGLRPFQDEDAEYFFGRDSQIKEIVTRLKNNRFVAVIGGSGSGKSSLVLAGAIPKLRTFAIRDSGDFWVPIVTTPGTNHVDGDSPIHRLAKKFCSVLTELPPPEEQERFERCTQLLRQPNGLDQLIRTWGRDIKNNDGVDLSLIAYPEGATNDGSNVMDQAHTLDQPYLVKVNFLFLIDQFEELFHPSNAAVTADCKHLVDRIVDHFKNAGKDQSRVCVAITMRSEHLNDCPRYPELPDAINAAAYLVKRLNESELREAIERPAKRFLRRQFQDAYQHARENGLSLPDEDEWPEDISFETNVVDRLLHDAEKIIAQQDHADHLPLLQHLLYWIWISAVKRNGHAGRPIPDAIIAKDLCSAVDPADRTIELAENLNALTHCLMQRCEWLFNRFPERCHSWEEVFRSLAFKEPNTGTYTQRRASMAELCKSPQIAVSGKEELKQCLLPWLGPHQYLFWDESSQTIKVTHESLIRRWKRFRDWADLEDRQFLEYLQILEDCTQWLEKGKNENDLTEGVALRRTEDYRLFDALKDDGIQKRFDSLLRMHRDRDRLKRGVNSAFEFLDKSINKRQNKRRLKQSIRLTSVLLLILTCLGAYLWMGAQVDEQQKTLLRSYGIAAETQFAMSPNGSVDKIDEVQLLLGNMFAAISYQANGQKQLSDPFLTVMYRSKLDASHKFELLSGSRTISGLRRVLLNNVWRYEPVSESLLKAEKSVPRECKIHSTSPDTKEDIDGYDKNVEFYTSAGRHGYGLIAMNSKVYWGKLEGKYCFTNHQQLVYWSTPNARLGFDANQRYIVDAGDGRLSITAIDWPADGKPKDGQSLPTATRFTYNNPPEGQNAKRLLLHDSDRHVSLPTLTGEFSQDIQVGKDWFRIFDSYPVPVQIEQAKYVDASKDEEGICMNWKGGVSSNLETWALRKTASELFCLIVSSKSKNNASTYFGDLYLVRYHELPHSKEQSPFPVISNIALGRNKPSEIRFDFKNGHILSKSGKFWLKQPWSADAWIKLATDVFNMDYYLEALKNNEKEPRYMRANWLFQDGTEPDKMKRLIEKTINPTPTIQLAKTIVSKE